MLGGELSRRYPSNRSVRSHLVVVLTPDGDDLASLGQGFEPVLVEAFVPELAVEALDVGVLGGFARLNQDVLNASCLHPCHEGSACELRAVVRSDGLWVAPEPCGLIQDAGDVCARHGQVHRDVNAFMGEVVRDGQALDASAIGQRVTHKVQAPGLIDAGGRHQWRAFTAVLLAFIALANSQALRTVEPEHLLVVGARKLGARPPHQVLKAFVDQHRKQFGVESICRVLQIAPSAYWLHAARQRQPAFCSLRAQRDTELAPQVQRVWHANLQVYGADKVWLQLNREGITVARRTVERLMRMQGLQGVRRGKAQRTTIADPKAPCPLDRVNRQFRAERPNQLWVSDFTYVSTWQGWVYVAFVIDVFSRRIVGWRQSSSMHTDFVLDALEQALYDRKPSEEDGLIHHSDRGSQGGFNRSSQHQVTRRIVDSRSALLQESSTPTSYVACC